MADTQSNSVVVAAPESLMAEIEDILKQIDVSINDITTTHIFHLQHADAVELAATISNIYSDTSGSTSATSRTSTAQGGRGGAGGFGGAGGGGQGQRTSTGTGASDRALMQAKVVAVGDPRTNSLIVAASEDTMIKVAETVNELDRTDAKKQHVYVVHLQHADPDILANVLRGALGQTITGAGSPQTPTALGARMTQGATLNPQDVLNTNTNNLGSGS